VPAFEPPAAPPGTPVLLVLEAGTVFRRLHHARFPADAFNRTPSPSRLQGGRFDSLDGRFGYLYLGDSDDAAIAETLCRDLPLDGTSRIVPRSMIKERRLTSVILEADVTVVSLRGSALPQLGQDLWLTKCEAGEYELTRRWTVAIRAWAPTALGFEYRARHDEDRLSWVLFDDDTAKPAVRALDDTIALDAGPGLATLKRVLSAHNAVLSSFAQ
jgi:hypothetical protein